MASISAASAGVRNSNFGGVADCAAWRACVAAERRAGQFVESHAALRPVPARNRKLRRLSSFSVKDNCPCSGWVPLWRIPLSISRIRADSETLLGAYGYVNGGNWNRQQMAAGQDSWRNRRRGNQS